MTSHIRLKTVSMCINLMVILSFTIVASSCCKLKFQSHQVVRSYYVLYWWESCCISVKMCDDRPFGGLDVSPSCFSMLTTMYLALQ